MKKRAHRAWKRKLTIIAGSILLILVSFVVWVSFTKTPTDKIAWGMTYSASNAASLGLDPKQAYLAMLDELKPKRLRLVAYWNQIQPDPGTHDFKDLDFQTSEADKRGIKYVIAVGRRVPRYPECFSPSWSLKSPADVQQQQLLNFITTTVKRFDNKPNLTNWQIENEPFLGDFGDCPPLNEPYLREEIALMRSLTGKQLIMTDSGELSFWYKASRYPDIFGTTLYRTVIQAKNNQVSQHHLPAFAYTLRAAIVKLIHPNVKKVVNMELQAEPWVEKTTIQDSNQAYYDLTMSHAMFDANIEYARQTGLSEVYFWGVEWWYFQKQLRNEPYYWQKATQVFADSAP